MKTYLLHLWDTVRSSYWFVPSVFAAVAVVLSIVLPSVDEEVWNSEVALPEWIRTTTDTARTTLSAMAGAMIAVTGTVFSVTIVTLSLTSQQFGPRLLRRFMYDLTTQVTLGVFISTGFYCLLLLRIVESREDGLSAPHLSVLTAMAMAVLSMVMLIVFIHHVAMLIQAPNVVAAVADDLDDAIKRLFPERIGDPLEEEEASEADAREQEDTLTGECHLVLMTKGGYVQAVANESLLACAKKHDIVLRLLPRPGDFVAIDTPLAEVWFIDAEPWKSISIEELTDTINEELILGLRRTPRQDAECAVNELVEIAVRALSPGINDPFTASTCIDRLGATLGRLAQRRPLSPLRCDDEGQLRVIARPETFPQVLGTAFNLIRQNCQEEVGVSIRLLEALHSIARHVTRAEDREAVKLHAEMVARHAENFIEETDVAAVEAEFARVLDTLDRGDS